MQFVARTRNQRLLAVAAAGLSVAGLALLGPAAGTASSHREAPLIAGTPSLDNTDLYAFASPDSPTKVTIVANWQPFEEPTGGPNFYPFATNTAHDILIDNDGDASADIIYRWMFTTSYKNPNTFLYNTGVVTSLADADLNLTQTYSLSRITKYGRTTILANAPVAPSFTGAVSMPDYAALSNAAITSFTGATGGAKSFAGQADDPFFADLRIFDLLYGKDLSEVGQDTLQGYNVNTIALQVQRADLALKASPARNPVVGIWTTTSRAGVNMSTGAATLERVSRLGNPLVNEVVIPVGRKNEFNVSGTETDAKFLDYVTKPEVPKLMKAIYDIPAPAEPRLDLVEVFLTGVCDGCGPVAVDLNSQKLNADAVPSKFAPSEQLRLNMNVAPAASPNRLGVVGADTAGFPNGRRLFDDVIDITLQAAEGVLQPGHPTAVDTLGDGVNANRLDFRNSFPYVALPNDVSVNSQS
jgi:uncharacterized protein DUF4331